MAENKLPDAERGHDLPFLFALSRQALRLFFLSLLFVFLVGLVGEGYLRYRGKTPQVLAAVGLAAIVDDKWSGWRLRPNVRTGPEYVLTNNLGMHAQENYSLKKRNGLVRVGVMGSSVAYGIGVNLEDTISMAAERRLQEKGFDAEVLNFGTHGYNILNIAAMVQTYVHQFDVDAIVAILDIQVLFPKYPGVAPLNPEAGMVNIKALNWIEAFIKRGSEYSALLTALDNRSNLRNDIARFAGLEMKPRLHRPKERPSGRATGGAPDQQLPETRP